LKTDELIDHLVADVRPVRRLMDPSWRAASWMAAAGVAVAVGALYFGLRRDLAVMWRDPLWLVRLALLSATAGLAVLTACRLAIPGYERRARVRWWPIVPLGALIAVSLAEVVTSAMTGTLGSPLRNWMCVRKMAVTGAAPALLAVLLVARAAPIEPRWTMLLGGLAAGAAGVVASEIACPVHAPIHILLWHILPIALFALAGAAIGELLWRRQRE
jgi:hypothetical protein